MFVKNIYIYEEMLKYIKEKIRLQKNMYAALPNV